ncbi:MAG: phosphonate C-P lyase system protein PhnH [Kiritimatiellia bacterium]
MTRFTPCVPTQAVYRTLLQAMAHPCCPYTLDIGPYTTPLRALTHTLLDHEVSFAVHPDAPDTWRDQIFTDTKSNPAAWEEADFLFIPGSGSQGWVSTARRGDPRYPDLGATLIYVVDAPQPDPGPILSGPGLREPGPPQVNPFTPEEWQYLKECNDDYPLGVDAFALFPDHTVCALPRSTRISSQ